MIGAPRQVVIGIGNLERGDDAAGRIVLRELRGRLSPDVALIERSGEASGLLAAMEGADAAYLIDACVSGAAAGTIHRVDVATSPWPRALRACSTHGLGVTEALELARALGMLPHRCIIYAIEGASFELGAPLTEQVRAQIDTLVTRLAAELHRARPTPFH